jgi:hypothetical protein
MSDPFFDENSYPWDRPEAFRLYDALVVGVPNPAEIDLLYKRCARRLPPLNLNRDLSDLWKDALEHLGRRGALRTFCELCLGHSAVAIREASAAMLKAATQASQEREAKARDLAARTAERLRAVRDEDVARPPVLSLQERLLRTLANELGRVTPRIFYDPRVRVERLAAANTALLSITPLIKALSTAAEKEKRQPMRSELQELDHTLQERRKAVAETLSALEQVRSERSATPLCGALDEEATELIAAGAEAVRRLM